MLEEYTAKRDFKQTAEPTAKIQPQKSAAKPLNFVVQYHQSRTPHYDFRLEQGGVLLSWAVPKGVPTTVGEKRLAIHVEDHPLEYRHFEGEIPAGNYGAGTVTIWDKGLWTPLETRDEAIKFKLDGEKLHGKYALILAYARVPDKSGCKTKYEGKQEQWLLIKERDATAKTQRIKS